MIRNTYKDGSKLEFGNPEHIKYVHALARYFDKNNPEIVCEIDVENDAIDHEMTFSIKCPICGYWIDKKYSYDPDEDFEEEEEFVIKTIAKKVPSCRSCSQEFYAKKNKEYGCYEVFCKHPKN